MSERDEAFADRAWWQKAGDVLGLTLNGWTFRNQARFTDAKGATVYLTGDTAARLASLSTEPMAQEGGEVGLAPAWVADYTKSDGTVDHFVMIGRGEREMSIHCHKIRGRAEYEAAEINHTLIGTPKPDFDDFDVDGSASPAPAQQEGGEVVAWKWRYTYPTTSKKPNGAWHVRLQPIYPAPLTEQYAGIEVIPLYASPVAPSEEVTDEMVEAAEAEYFGRHERGFVMKPLIPDQHGRRDMRAALLAALQTRSNQP